jgi:DNA-directed RNA polymerase specialized sigma24 family protein
MNELSHPIGSPKASNRKVEDPNPQGICSNKCGPGHNDCTGTCSDGPHEQSDKSNEGGHPLATNFGEPASYVTSDNLVSTSPHDNTVSDLEVGSANNSPVRKLTIRQCIDKVGETTFVAAATHICNVLSSKFTFGYYERQDIRQDIFVFCMEAMPFYDGVRNLSNFLYCHAHNRCINLHRNKMRRTDCPCIPCDEGRLCSELNGEPHPCKRYLQWVTTNAMKSSLMQAAPCGEALPGHESAQPEDEVARKEIWERIDRELPAHLRSDYLKWREGQPITKLRREKVLTSIRTILSINSPDLSDRADEDKD